MIRQLSARICQNSSRRSSIHSTSIDQMAMPAGTKLPGFEFLKGGEPVAAKSREEYPDWINDLSKPMKSLAELKKMKFEDATDKERMRYLVLTRRQLIKENNMDANS